MKPSERIHAHLLWLRENGYEATWEEREPTYWKVLDDLYNEIGELKSELQSIEEAKK